MSLDMFGTIDPVMESRPTGGVFLVTPGGGSYGPGGVWQPDPAPTVRELFGVAIQAADARRVEILRENGGITNPTDVRNVYINDGTVLRPDDDGKFSQLLRFSDGNAVRDWRIVEVDNRPWRNYTRATVERYRGRG